MTNLVLVGFDRDDQVLDTEIEGRINAIAQTIVDALTAADVGAITVSDLDDAIFALNLGTASTHVATDFSTPAAVATAIGNAIASLGLGTAATHAETDFATPAQVTTAVSSAISTVVGGAPGIFDTLGEIVTQMQSDESGVSALITAVAGKLSKSANLSDLTDAAAARSNLNLNNINNTSDADKPVSILQAAADGIVATNAANALAAHADDHTNPHVVTKAQVNLGNADNTPDSGKPVSGPQQIALDLKQDISGLDGAMAFPAHRLPVGNEPGAIICWTFDDGYDLAASGYFPLMDARGIKGTLFLTKNWVDKPGIEPTWNDAYITQSQVQTIATNGHELGSHGVDHESVVTRYASLGAAGLAALEDTVVDYIQSTYTDSSGNPMVVLTGAYPAGASNKRSREVIGRRHRFMRGTTGVGAVDAFNPYDVPGFDVGPATQIAIQAKIDEAVANDSVCVFLFHGVGGGTPTTRATALAKIAACMDYATGLGIRQIPFGQAMSERTMRRSPGHMVDSSGNLFSRSVRSYKFRLIRDDKTAAEVWAAMDPITNAAYFDGNNGQPFDFRTTGLRVTGSSGLKTGRRIDYSGTTTNGSPSVLLPLLNTDNSIIGKTIVGPGIPAGALIGSIDDATHLSMVAADGVTPAPAGAGAGTGTITIGWPSAPTAAFYGSIEFHKSPKAVGASSATGYGIYTLDGTQTFLIKAGGIVRFTSGVFNIDTAGGNLELKANRTRYQDTSGNNVLSFAPSVPGDVTIDNGETVIYPDPSTGTLLYKGKKADGTVFGPATFARTSDIGAKRVYSTADTATLTVDASSFDDAKVTALAQAMTIAAPTGSPTPMQPLIIRIKDNGTARGLTWNAVFRPVGVVLPTATVASKTVYVGALWNADDSVWDAIAVATQA